MGLIDKVTAVSKKIKTARAARVPEYGQTRETWSEDGGTTLQP